MQLLKSQFAPHLALSALAVVLVGCSGEPSDSDIERSIKASSDQAVQQLEQAGVMSPGLRPTIYGIKKLGCAAAQGEAGFICDIESDVSTLVTGRIKTVEKYRLVKNSDGWTVIDKVE